MIFVYRVTRLLVQNLPLTSKVKFRFGLARPGQARPKRNFTFEVNGRFCTRRWVTLYVQLISNPRKRFNNIIKVELNMIEKETLGHTLLLLQGGC